MTALRVPVGVWDQVVEFGQYQHETVNGDPCLSIHDATTCKVMLDDFAAHPECDIFYDKQHEVEPILGVDALDREKMQAWGKGDGHALAWSNAMCMVIGGQVTRYEAHAGAPPAAPRVDDVLMQSDGTRRPEGVFCLRSQITPRGADPVDGLDNFRKTSPYYVPERDGNRLLNLTVTNDPRMRGCALAFSRDGRIAMSRVTQEQPPAQRAPSKEDRMDPKEMARLMEAAGCKAEDKPEDKAEKMAAYARKMEDDRSKMEADSKKEKEDSKKEKEASEMARKKMEGDMEEMRRKMEAPPHKEPDGDEGKAAMQAMSRRTSALEEKNAMLEKELKEVKGSASEFQAMQRKTKEDAAKLWAKNAIAMRRVKPTHKGSVEETEKWFTERRMEEGEAADDRLSDEGTFGISEPLMMERHTQNGAGVGAPAPRADMSVDDEMNSAISAQYKAMKAEGIDLKKVDGHRMAMQRIRDKNPNLHKRYVNAGSN